ncbi:MAG: hypothetical protein KME59_14075 [Trichormus sp. ATA11-4-KO1]|nr:hypothetical protein [Trichormus sp. ATA11-4-KO1]
MVKFRFVENLPLVILVTSIVYLGSCANQPTDQQLEVWRKEAIAPQGIENIQVGVAV